jgi:hypothetical protein
MIKALKQMEKKYAMIEEKIETSSSATSELEEYKLEFQNFKNQCIFLNKEIGMIQNENKKFKNENEILTSENLNLMGKQKKFQLQVKTFEPNEIMDTRKIFNPQLHHDAVRTNFQCQNQQLEFWKQKLKQSELKNKNTKKLDYQIKN